MKQIALQQAKGRLKLTERAAAALNVKGQDPLDFQTHWLDFLVQWKGTYTKIQEAAKDTPQETQWFGSVTRERKADPLLRYLFEARNDGEHGLSLSAWHDDERFDPISLQEIARMVTIFSPEHGLELAAKITGSEGSEAGQYAMASPAVSRLIEVTEFDGKKKVPPPTSHLGKEMEPKPLIAADLGLRWLAALTAKAEAMSTQ